MPVFFFIIVFHRSDNGIIKKKCFFILTTAVEITILAKKSDGIFDAVKMDPFF